ncbi:hypothetical protein JTB14_030351 [Gonioctena quinquepunctata]|nr:hypothetical protein JTB14_030351 [Gonioctena quinquepunctata]
MFRSVIDKSAVFRRFTKSRSYTTVSKGWLSKRIAPDVIDDPPTGKLIVEYPKLSINEGSPIVHPSQVKDPPKVSWMPQEKGVYFTLCMIDPDSPSRTKHYLGEWLNWLVVNIADYKVELGQVLAEYIGAGPGKNTGLHRYVFLLYKQPSKINFKETKLNNQHWKGRAHFSIRKFAQKYKLGNPYAGNFFEAEYDEYVDELMKKLKLKI